MSEVIEKLIDSTIDCEGVVVTIGDEVEVIECVGNLGMTGLRGKVYTIKHCQKDEKEWIILSIQDSKGTVIGMLNTEFKKIFREVKVLEDRKITLLKACRDLLNKQKDSCYVLDLLSETVFYDDADCDGYCLLDDIEIELGIEGEE